MLGEQVPCAQCGTGAVPGPELCQQPWGHCPRPGELGEEVSEWVNWGEMALNWAAGEHPGVDVP